MPNGGTAETKRPVSHFRKDEAARHMLTRVPTVRLKNSVGAARKLVLDPRARWESISYVYVLDAKSRLKGVVSIRELLQTGARNKMKKFVRKDLIVAHPHSPLRVVAGRAISHNVKALPIVDDAGHFMGMVGTDTILDTLESEHVRDALAGHQIPGGTSFADVFTAKVSSVIRWRSPWLIAGIIGGMLTATIVEGFHEDLNKAIELAFFIPVMLYMGAAVGNQTQMLYIRGIAYQKIDTRAYLIREFFVDLVIGSMAAVLLGIFAFFVTPSQSIAATVAISSLLIISTAGLIAIVVSSVFAKFTKDPALGGGPFQTIIQDVTSLLIYFVVATIILL